MNKVLQQLAELMKERPDLSVVPMVEDGIACDDTYQWWRGGFERVAIEKYYELDERIVFYSSDVWDLVSDVLSYDEQDELGRMSGDEAAEKAAWEKINALHWKEAIILYIGLPDVDW